MFRRFSAAILLPVVLVMGGTAGLLRAQDEPTTTTVSPETTTTVVVPTTIPDDYLTLFPAWSEDNYGYLVPDASSASTMPATGGASAPLAGISALAILVGLVLSLGARSRVRRR